mmetsp:Transcript_21141/g.65253  ORF Transcript_21141/g.65253 Transcript_21141/m.65253 type:complete len:625 (-) Transcript_21141:66-1940(-)
MASVLESRSFRLLALANVGGVGLMATALLRRPSPEEARREAAAVREDLAALKARVEAAQRAVRLATTVATVALDYKVAQWRGESGAVRAAQSELRAAQDEQEAAGLAVERAASDDERQRGLDAAKAARSRVLEAAAALAAERAQEETSESSNLHSRNAKRLLAMARANGGCYVKFAQHVSQLDYMVPDEYLEVFASCLDDAPHSDFGEVQRVLSEDLGGTCDELFDDFEREPIASASLAQVHRATFRGRKVAVKVQHRGLRETSRGDLEACALATKFVGRFFPEFRLGWLVEEIAPHLPIELDFRVEAQNCARAARQFRGWRNVRVPDVIAERSTSRILTMTFEPGVNGADRAKVLGAGVDVRKAATLAVRAFSASIFSYGFVHCDPHSANVLFAKKKKTREPLLVLLDHGLYRELDDSFRLEYARLWRSIVLADTDGIAESSQRLGVGDLYPLFAAMLARRPWDDVANPDLASLAPGDAHGDAELLRGYAHRYAKEITLVLDRVPRQMLLLLKMSDCLRHLELSLLRGDDVDAGESSGINSHVITAHACADALFAHDRDFRAFARVKLRLWAYDLRQRFFESSPRGSNSRGGLFSVFFFRRQRHQSDPFVAVPEHVSQFATTS